MAITCVAGSHAEQQFGVSAAARTLAYGGAVTAGSLLVVVVSTFNNAITVTVSDDVNGAYTQAAAGYAVNGAVRCSIWYFPNSGAGTPTVTVTPSASAYIALGMDEYTGVKTTTPLRDSIIQTGNGADPFSLGPVASQSGDLVVCGLGIPGADTVTSTDAPFTLLTNLPATALLEGIYTAYDLNAPGSESCTVRGAPSAGTWAGSLAAFQAAAVPATQLLTNFVTDTILLRAHTRVAYGSQ